MSVEADGVAGGERVLRRTRSAGTRRRSPTASWRQTLQLAFQSIGVVYGDVGTSPLYVYSGTFPDGIQPGRPPRRPLPHHLHPRPRPCSYVFIVLYANDNGDGGRHTLPLF
ncbi:hypothetical protein ZWY2020_051280 [Hordeum vulgare]|nr:hypothetical protein ZWY2020_051280 [Hordeum vulgare]